MEEIRSYNVGVSDYAKHKVQPWDLWMYISDPWRADIIKRIMRTNNVYGRKMDYEKIKHVLLKIRSLQESHYKFIERDNRDEGYTREEGYEFLMNYINSDIKEDYSHLTGPDIDILKLMLERPDFVWPIESALSIIDSILLSN